MKTAPAGHIPSAPAIGGRVGASNRSRLITVSLIILFLIKPAIDLTWDKALLTVGGRAFSLLHVAGALVLVYFGRYLFVYLRHSAPYAGVFKAFIAWNLVSIITTYFVAEMSAIQVIDLLMRVADSYIIYNVAFFAARGSVERDHYRIVRAVSIGTFIALFVNLIAIVMGYGGVRMGSNLSIREYGVYHDPGTLSNIALYNIIFTSFMYHLMPRKNPAWLIYGAVTVIISLYLIYIGLSRAVFIQMIVFGLIYVGIFRKGMGKFVTVGFMSLVVLIGAIAGLDYGRYTQRFQSEITVLTAPEKVSRTKQDKDVDLGAFERLGSNRGQLAAYALDDIIKRPTWQIMVGNFTESPSHSDYIDVLSRNGVIGLLIYLLLLFLIWRKTLKLVTSGNRKQGWAMDVLAFALINLYILYSIPFRPLSYTTLAWFMWAVIGYAFGRRYWNEREARSRKMAEMQARAASGDKIRFGLDPAPAGANPRRR